MLEQHHSSEDTRRRLILPGILVLALFLRLAFSWALYDHPIEQLDFFFTTSDMYGNLEWSNDLRLGNVWGDPPWHPQHPWMLNMAPLSKWHEWWGGEAIFQQAPLYPYFMATALKIFSGRTDLLRLLQHGIGVLTVLGIFLAGLGFYGRRAGLFAAFFAAVYFPFICFEHFFLRDFLAVFLLTYYLVWAIWGVPRGHLMILAGGGFLTALAILTRVNLILLGPLAGVLIWTQTPRPKKGIPVYLMGLIIGLLPLFIRNGVVDAPLFAISNRLIEGLIEGLAYDASPSYMSLPASMQGILEQSQGSLGSTLISIYKTYPHGMAVFTRLLLKSFALLHLVEPYNNLNLYYFQQTFPWLKSLPGYASLFCLAFPGALATCYKRRPSWIHGCWFLLFLSLLIPPILARYRLILIPFYFLWAGYLGQLLSRHLRLGFLHLLLILSLGLPLLEWGLQKTLPLEATQRRLESAYCEEILLKMKEAPVQTSREADGGIRNRRL